jgi:hypothetical protein
MSVMIVGAALIGAAMAWHAWRTSGARRVSATCAALIAGTMLAVLAWRPTRAMVRHDTVTIADDASFAEVEATAMRLAPAAAVTVAGDGLDSASLSLLSRHRIAWQPREPAMEIVALAWPHRTVVGERTVVEGAVGGGDSSWVVLEHPDGARDSVLTDSSFRLVVVPRAAGAWQWVVYVGAHADTIGVHVMPAPAPRMAWIDGRPSREASVLGRLVVAQGGGMLQRTRLTATDVRIARHGVAPDGSALTADVLRRLDAVVIGPGGLADLGEAERSALRSAIDSGLGVVHLADSVIAAGAVMPFALRHAGGDARSRVAFDGGATSTAVPLAPVTVSDGEVLLRSVEGVPLAWRTRIGRGTVVATRLVQVSRWGLAGEADAEAAWWAALLGPALRTPHAEWRVRDDALVRVDHPVLVQRVGDATDSIALIERGVATMMSLATSHDSGTKQTVLWPRDTGWIALAQDGDTVRLHVAARDAHPSLDRAARRHATAVAAARTPDTASVTAGRSWREPLPLWWAWVALVAALTALWRRPRS